MPDHPPEPIGPRLKRLREAAGLSVAELAARSGRSREAIHRIEAGAREPAWDMLRALAFALGASLGDFQGCTPSAPSDPTP